jgi:hypothetical protein
LLSLAYSCPGRHYIAGARQKRPTVPQEVSNYIVESYVRLRKESAADEQDEKSKSYASARTLLGVLRLSQALARLRYSDAVEHGDVDEALRLMEASKESLIDEEERHVDADRSNMSKIYRLIKDEFKKLERGGGRRRPRAKRFGRGPDRERDMDIDDDDYEDDPEELSIIDLRQRMLARGFTEADFMATIQEARNSIYKLFLFILTSLFDSTKGWRFGCVSRIIQNFVCYKRNNLTWDFDLYALLFFLLCFLWYRSIVCSLHVLCII